MTRLQHKCRSCLRPFTPEKPTDHLCGDCLSGLIRDAIEQKHPNWEVKGQPYQQAENLWRAFVAFAPSGPLALVEFSVSGVTFPTGSEIQEAAELGLPFKKDEL